MSQSITSLNGLAVIIGQRQSGVTTTALAMFAALYGTTFTQDFPNIKHFLSFSSDNKEMFDVSLATAAGSRYSTNQINHFQVPEKVGTNSLKHEADVNSLKYINDVVYKFYSDIPAGTFTPPKIAVYISQFLDFMSLEELYAFREKFPAACIIVEHSLADYKTSAKAAKLQLLYGSDENALEVLTANGVVLGNMDAINQHYLVNNLRSIINA